MKVKFLAAVVAALAFSGFQHTAEGCSRVLYVGNDSLRIVGRSLDWKTPIPTNIYVYPRGMHKKGNDLPGSVEWTSKYGAVYAVGYDGGVTEGMNEKGLVVNGLFCKGTVYVNDSTANRPPMSLAMFPAWILDMCATTDEAIAMLAGQDFTISGATFDHGTASTLHWGITDATGKSVILEYDNGNLKYYEGQDIPVLTNDPDFPQMNAINDYWVKKGGINTLSRAPSPALTALSEPPSSTGTSKRPATPTSASQSPARFSIMCRFPTPTLLAKITSALPNGAPSPISATSATTSTWSPIQASSMSTSKSAISVPVHP